MPDEFGGVELEEPKDEFGGVAIGSDEFGGVAVDERPFSRIPNILEVDDQGLPTSTTPRQRKQIDLLSQQAALLPQIESQSAEAEDLARQERSISNFTGRGMLNLPGKLLAAAGGEYEQSAGGNFKPAIPPGPLVNITVPSDDPSVLAGIGRSSAKLVSGLTDPDVFMTLPAAELGAMGKLLFAATMGKDVPEQVQHAITVWNDPKSTKADKAESISDPVVSSAMLAALAHSKTPPSGVPEFPGLPDVDQVARDLAKPAPLQTVVTKAKEAGLNKSAEALEKTTKGEPDASIEPSATGVPEPEVRTPVGEEAPLRQQGEAADVQAPSDVLQKEEVVPSTLHPDSQRLARTLVTPEDIAAATDELASTRETIAGMKPPADPAARMKYLEDKAALAHKAYVLEEALGTVKKPVSKEAGQPTGTGESAPAAPAPVIPKVKIGEDAKIGGVDATLSDAQNLGGMRYEIYTAAKGSDKRAVVRVLDPETGEATTIKVYPSFDLAAKEYANTVRIEGGKVPGHIEKPSEAASERVLVGKSPQPHTVLERPKASQVEIDNGEQPVRVKNEKTGEESTVLESQLKPIKPRDIETGKATAAAKALADKLREQFKTPVTRKELGSFGVVPKVINTAVEIAARIIEGGGKVVDAINAAVDHIKAHHKGAFDEAGFRDQFMRAYHPEGVEPTSIEKLTDSIEKLASSGEGSPAKAFDLGAAVSRAKDSISAATDGLRAAGRYLKRRLIGKPEVTKFKGVLGDRHLSLSESAANVRRWMEKVKKQIPDVKLREAISNWIDVGGDPALLKKAAAETKPQFRAGYERALKLTPEEMDVAKNLKTYFDERLQQAIDAGVLEDGIENYIHRVYEQDSPWRKGVIAELRSGIFAGKPSLAKQRVFEYDFEAEKQGKRPIKDFAKRVAAYDLALNKAIADRQAVKDMMAIKMPDGRPMIDTAGGGKVIKDAAGETDATLINRSQKRIDESKPENNRGDFKSFDHPALRKWKWVASDSEGKPIFVQGDVLVHPDAINQIRTLFERSRIRQHPVGNLLLKTSSTIKQTMLDLSLFHQVQIGVHGMEHRTFKPVKEIDFSDPNVRGLIRGGAVVGETSGAEHFQEGLAGSSLTKHIPWLGDRIQAYQQYLFGDYIPRLKVSMGLHALERNRERFKNLSEDELYHMTANQMNAAFGELNYEMMGRSKTTQDMLRLMLLAPDFLEARGRFAGQASTVYGGLPHVRDGKLTVGEQGNALILGAITMYITARIMNKVLNDEYHFEPKNAFNIIHNGRAYGLRTVQGDLIHAATEPGQFTNHRLNPVYGRPLLEFVTGRDYFGRKRSAGDKLKDIAQTPIPISLKGAISGQEQTLFDSFLNSVGIVAKRDSASSDIAKLAEDWRKKNKVSGEPGEFIYDAEKDKYRPIRLAAERGDVAVVRSEIAKAIAKDGITENQVYQHFRKMQSHNFSGSRAHEQDFVDSLTADQKNIYADAKKERERINDLVAEALR
jgi:hypothetical protein